MVMTGMRVQVGTQAIERAPSYVEVFGRTMQINLTRARWFDFPFTREEALQADKKLSIFSKSNDIVTQWMDIYFSLVIASFGSRNQKSKHLNILFSNSLVTEILKWQNKIKLNP